MSGSNKGAHKMVMPSQCGQVPNRNGQSAPSQNYLHWRAAGFPARPNRQRRGGRQQANQVAMPTMLGQLLILQNLIVFYFQISRFFRSSHTNAIISEICLIYHAVLLLLQLKWRNVVICF